MPDNQSPEKYRLIEALGAEVRKVKAVPYSDPNQYQHVARRLADELPDAVWANQFDNTANRRAHVESTGPEIWEQTGGRVDAFVASSGTGGTLAGTSEYLKGRRASIRTVLADPPGSSLYEFVRSGEVKATGKSSITEGIGIGRVTANFAGAPVDAAVHVEDPETVQTVYRLLHEEGLFLGSTSGINVAGGRARRARDGPGPHDRHDPLRRWREIRLAALRSQLADRKGAGRVCRGRTAVLPRGRPVAGFPSAGGELVCRGRVYYSTTPE